MADAVIHVLPEGIGQEQYDAVNEKLEAQGAPPSGLKFHAAGQGEDGRWRIIEVWDSRSQLRRVQRAAPYPGDRRGRRGAGRPAAGGGPHLVPGAHAAARVGSARTSNAG